MSKSPLSGAFSGSSEPAKKNKKNGAILLIAGIALTSSIGGVFAANSSITLNDSAAIEFGQGVADVDVCAESADVTMTQVYEAESAVGAADDEFYVGVVTVTFATGCDEKYATVSLMNGATVAASFEAEVTDDEVSNTYDADDAIIAGDISDVTVTTADESTTP
jgi:hypothetical protein